MLASSARKERISVRKMEREREREVPLILSTHISSYFRNRLKNVRGRGVEECGGGGGDQRGWQGRDTPSSVSLLCLDDFDDNTPPLVSILFYFSRLDDDLHSLLRCDTTVAARKMTVMRAQTKRLVKD